MQLLLSTHAINRVKELGGLENVIRLFSDKGINKIKRELGFGRAAILKIRNIRNPDEIEMVDYMGEQPQNQRKYSVKDDYFDILSPNMAYLLGFFAADGCITSRQKQFKVAVSSKDMDILEKFKSELELESPIKSFVNKDGFEVSSITWTSHPMIKSLSKYSITPKKTFKLEYPNLPKELHIHFIRGYFDGDGSVSYLRQNGIRWQVCSATPKFLEKIVEYFKDTLDISATVQKQNNIYAIQYSTNPSKKNL